MSNYYEKHTSRGCLDKLAEILNGMCPGEFKLINNAMISEKLKIRLTIDTLKSSDQISGITDISIRILQMIQLPLNVKSMVYSIIKPIAVKKRISINFNMEFTNNNILHWGSDKKHTQKCQLQLDEYLRESDFSLANKYQVYESGNAHIKFKCSNMHPVNKSLNTIKRTGLNCSICSYRSYYTAEDFNNYTYDIKYDLYPHLILSADDDSDIEQSSDFDFIVTEINPSNKSKKEWICKYIKNGIENTSTYKELMEDIIRVRDELNG